MCTTNIDKHIPPGGCFQNIAKAPQRVLPLWLEFRLLQPWRKLPLF